VLPKFGPAAGGVARAVGDEDVDPLPRIEEASATTSDS